MVFQVKIASFRLPGPLGALLYFFTFRAYFIILSFSQYQHPQLFFRFVHRSSIEYVMGRTLDSKCG